MNGINGSDSTRQHDGLVITIYPRANARFECTKDAEQCGPAEFVVECSATNRRLKHDFERGGDAPRGFRLVDFPGLLESRNFEVGDNISGQTKLGFRPASGGPFVAQFTAGACGCPWEGCDRGRVVMSLHFEYRVRNHRLRNPGTVRSGPKTLGRTAFEHCSVIRIRHNRTGGGVGVGRSDHPKQR